MDIIDLRSDTVTLPTPEMRRAMAEAVLGDDVYGEDPTVNELERRAAARMGKEAALFVTSGTMGNIIAILSWTQRGDEVIVGSEAHILHYEVGGAGALAGVVLRAAPNNARGGLDPADVDALIRGENVHFPRTALVCLENTHNRCGGGAQSVAETAAVADVAHRAGVALHIDGARIFNAEVALGVSAADLVAPADSVTFCLSKGLSAPVGSLLCGSEEFITSARRYRKMLGGGMRQAGILAAAGLVALDTMVERLADDHAHARLLAQGLAALPGVELDPAMVETNIVVFEVRDRSSTDIAERLKAVGVLASVPGPRRLRMVTHHGIGRRQIEQTLERAARALGAVPA